MTKRDRWILSEFLVARDRVTRFGEPLLKHRFQTPFAEVDLVFEANRSFKSRLLNKRSFVIVEVKSFDGDLWSRRVLTRKQQLRLERARSWLESRAGCEVQLKLAVVGTGGAIQYFDFPL